nr:MAG TPA: hypothetical protein [Caudoviricetes sp.]
MVHTNRKPAGQHRPQHCEKAGRARNAAVPADAPFRRAG